MEKQFEHIIIGGLSGTVASIFIDVPLSKIGLLYTVTLKDSAGTWIWGIGTGDLITLLIGGLMFMEKIPGVSKEAGLGWLLSVVVSKISELAGTVQRVTGTWPNREWTITV